jgi:hypothetical protein
MKTRITLSTWVVILLTTLSLPVSAQFSGSGSGSSTDPFIITSGDELNQVRNFLNKSNVYFKMLNDIDLTQWLAENNPTQGWSPIGNSSTNAFSGNFNGNNCKIIGLRISRSTTDYVGLFGYLNSGVNIHDLTLNQCDVSGQNYSGVLSGYVNGQAQFTHISIQGQLKGNNNSGTLIGYYAHSGQSVISNITIQGNVTGNDYTGNLIGYDSGFGQLAIKKITIQGNVKGNNYVGILGGLFNLYFDSYSGNNQFSTIIDHVNLKGSVIGNSYVGGVAGSIQTSMKEFDSSATTSISNLNVEGTVSGQAQTGGIVGYIYSNSKNTSGNGHKTDSYVYISNALFKGAVTGKLMTGGLIGQISQVIDYINYTTDVEKVKIQNAEFTGNVYGTDQTGGIVGYSNSTFTFIGSWYNNRAIKNVIDRCITSGSVIGISGSGGILGESANAISITNCHSHCDITGTTSTGGIVGKSLNPYIVKNYSAGNVRGTSNVGGILGESVSGGSNTVQSNVSINNVISGNANVGRITGLFKVPETLTSAQSNYGWALTKVIVNNINTPVVDSYQHGITSGLSLFKKKATYQGIGWDFTTVNYWRIVEGQSFPYFTWQTPPAVITTSPIKPGTTTIRGTSVANATINLEVGNKEYSTTANSLNWSIDVDPLLGGDTISVIARQDTLSWSYQVQGIVELQGSGSLADPYQIFTAKDLNAVDNNMVANYKLMNDIDLTSWILTNYPTTGWPSIGNRGGYLSGAIDGNNHKIVGLWQQNTTQASSGLVAAVSSNGAVRNLTIETAIGKKCTGINYTAILAGYNSGTMENCKVSGSVQGDTIGCITGYNSGTINNCTASATVQGNNAGCIAGYNSGTIKNCIGKGLITSIVSSGKAGGIVGENTGLISNCEYTGDITCNIGNGYVGGIAGSSSDSIVNCYYSGTLSSSIATAHVGGIVGLNSGLISTSYSLGTINASGATAYAGGIAGDNNSTTSEINNSESGMNINSTGASTVCGGVVGITKGKVINCYASGTITSGYRGSGVVGYMDGTGAKVLGCVGLNTNISGKNSVCRVLGGVMNSAIAPSTTDNYGCKDMLITINGVVQPAPAENYLQGTTKERTDLKKQSFYEGIGWNFISIWNIIEGVDYPYLRFLYKPVTSISMNKSATTLNVGSNELLTPTILPENATNKNVTWSSSNNLVATVDALGKVTALSAGTATITVTTIDQNKTAQCLVTVVNQVTSVSLNKSQITLNVGSFETLTVTLSPADATNKNVTWSSSNNSVATVDAAGKVTALSSGSSTITVTTIDQNKTAQCVVTVILLPETAGTITGLTTVCQGQNTVTYTVPVINNATSYIWTLPGGATGTSTTNSISVNYGISAVSGNITVKGHNTNGDGAVSTLAITVNATPAAPIVGTITQPTCALATGSVVLSGLPATGTWTLMKIPDGTTTTGTGNSTTISLLAAGTYSFTVTNSSGCISAASANVVINAQPSSPSAPIVGTVTQPTCSLATGSVVLSGLPTTGTWTLTRNPGGNTTTGTGSSTIISLLAAGTYTYTVTNSSGCISAASANVVINPQPLMPNQPIISLNANGLHSDALIGNQWYNKNGLIDGATYQDYTPASSGDYYVVVSINGCTSNPSNSIYFIPTANNAIELAKSIMVYPNPVTNELTIEFEGNTVETEFKVINSIGQVVFTGIILEKTVVKTESFTPGIYFVRFRSGNTFEFKKIIKN